MACPQHRTWSDDLMLAVVDGSLAGCIFVLPFLFGGQHPLGRLLLVALAVTAAVAWTARLAFVKKRPETPWRWSGVELLLAAGVALLVLQITPLEPPTLKALAPHTLEILPLWQGQATGDSVSPVLGSWSTVSLAPAATRSALVIFLAYCLLFVVAVQRIRRREDVERLLRWIAISATLMAVFGLVQLFTSNGKYFWFYERPFSHTYKVPKGAFGNRNHFADFLALAIGALIWWLQDSLRPSARASRRRRDPLDLDGLHDPGTPLATTLRALALAVVLFAVLLSLSRGGLVVAGLAAAISGAVCYRAGSAGFRLVAGLAAVGLLIAASLAIFGHQQVSKRLDALAAASVDSVDQADARRTIWNATLQAAADFKLLGAGVGSFREVAPMYVKSTDTNQYYGHAENGYLEIALEAGPIGLGLTLIGVACCAFWCLAGILGATSARSRETLICMGAVAAGLTVSAVHSLVDFVWYNPACMTLAVILAACACRLRQLSREPSARCEHRVTSRRKESTDAGEPFVGNAFMRSGSRGRRRRPDESDHYERGRSADESGHYRRFAAALASMGLVVLGAWMIYDRIGPASAEGHLARYYLLRSTTSDVPPPADQSADQAMPDLKSEPAAQVSVAAEERLKAELEKVVQRDPDHARAHLELAACYLRLFERLQQDAVNVMSLGQIRDAAVRSQFTSRRALDEWLHRAVGDQSKYLDAALVQTRRALALCPLLGEGYLYLGELCFLEGSSAAAETAYLDQAMTVRPFDGMVLFQAGKEAWLAGDYAGWLGYWQRAFRCGQFYQRQMIDWLVGRSPPDSLDQEIQFFLEAFLKDDPDNLFALAYLDQRYREIARPEQTVALRRAYSHALEVEAAKSEGVAAGKLWMAAAGIERELAEPAPAIDFARKSVACQPRNHAARWMLAQCLLDGGNYAEAEEHLAWLVKRQPADRTLEKAYKETVKMRIAAAAGSDRIYSVQGASAPSRPDESGHYKQNSDESRNVRTVGGIDGPGNFLR